MAEENLSLLRHTGFVQLRIMAGDVDANLTSLQRLLRQLDPPPQSLIVLPELWATGFAYLQLPALREKVTALSARLRKLAETYDILLAGSLPEAIAGQEIFYNTLRFYTKDGPVGCCRKQHVFPGEEQAFAPSPGGVVPIATPHGLFACLICYDLRFPDLARRQCQQGADLLLCSAEWPAARLEHWRALAVARAIENQTFLVACNGVGNNGPLPLGGHSLIVSPIGEILHEAGDDETAKIVELDWQLKQEARARFTSFATAPFVSSGEKIATAKECVANAERRVSAGQRVMYVAIESEAPFLHTVELLEKARQQGDHLIVGVNSTREDGEKASETFQLQQYAALGCVDSIFDLGRISSSEHERLREICRSVNY